MTPYPFFDIFSLPNTKNFIFEGYGRTMKSRRIYVASSWRNEVHPQVVKILRDAGHEVCDFRLPDPNNPGFSWGDIAGAWKDWRVEDYIEGLKHPIAHAGFLADKNALDWCDTCILLLPCGKSAHLEAGYAIGKGKDVFIVLDPHNVEPELMYLFAGQDHVVSDISQVLPKLENMGQICTAK